MFLDLIFDKFLILKQIQEKNNALLPSIYQTKRQISEVNIIRFSIVQKTLLNIETIFKTFEQSLKKVTLYQCLISYSDLQGLVFLAKDVEEFNLLDSRIKMKEFHSAAEEERSKQFSSFTMPNLKKMDLSGTLQYFAEKGNVHGSLYNLARMLGRCPSLKSLSADSSLLTHFPFAEKKLTCLKIQRTGPKNMRIGDVMEAQYNLTSLDLTSCYIQDEVIERITKCIDRLEVLKINISALTQKSFLSLANLHLKELNFRAGTANWITGTSFKSFKELKVLYANVEELLIPLNSFSALFHSMGSVKKFHIKTNCARIFELIFQSGLKETLASCTVEFSNIGYITTLVALSPKLVRLTKVVKQTMEGLKELTIINVNEHMASTTNFAFLKIFCNIKKLTIKGFAINEKYLIWCISHFPMLEHLKLKDVKNGKTNLIINESLLNKIDNLNFHGNLKFLSTGFDKMELSDKFTSSHFAVIKQKQPNQLVLRHR